MIPYRSFWMYILLSIVTFGIYPLYWIYRLQEDLNTINVQPSNREPVITLLLQLLLGSIYLWFWMFEEGNALQVTGERRGAPIHFKSSGYVILGLLSIVSFGIGTLFALYIFIGHFNMIAETYNNLHKEPDAEPWL